MGEGVTSATMWASSGVTGRGTEVIGVIGMEGVTCDELKTCGLKGVGIRKEDALGECGKDGRDVIGEGGVEATKVGAVQTWAVSLPFGVNAVFGGR